MKFNFENVELLVTLIGSILTTILASSGFWLFVNKRNENRNYERRLLLGLAHDRIMTLGMRYIDRGSITRDEFENLNDYLYEPYKEMGGNGSAKRIMDAVARLPICTNLNKVKDICDETEQ